MTLGVESALCCASINILTHQVRDGGKEMLWSDYSAISWLKTGKLNVATYLQFMVAAVRDVDAC